MSERRIVSVALVGWEAKQEDWEVLSVIESHLVEECSEFFDGYAGANLRFFNMGRRSGDFFEDAGAYDVVVLMRLFNSGGEPHTEVSPQQSPARWRQQLASTGAVRIYVWGREDSDSSVSTEYIGDIPGYARQDAGDGSDAWPVGIYRRKDAAV